MAEWIKPKTNWSADDFFNADDYNRIKNNLDYLYELYLPLFPNVTQQEMIAQIIGDDASASTYTVLSHNIFLLNKDSIRWTDIEDVVYRGNKKILNYEEWNRIEKLILRFYREIWNGYRDIIPKLPKRLGGRKAFGRRV